MAGAPAPELAQAWLALLLGPEGTSACAAGFTLPGALRRRGDRPAGRGVPGRCGAGRRALPLVGLAAGAALLLFLVLPIVALFVTTGAARGFLAGLRQPLVGPALLLSLRTTGNHAWPLVVLLGTPLAYWLARARAGARRDRRAPAGCQSSIPPAVAGMAPAGVRAPRAIRRRLRREG